MKRGVHWDNEWRQLKSQIKKRAAGGSFLGYWMKGDSASVMLKALQCPAQLLRDKRRSDLSPHRFEFAGDQNYLSPVRTLNNSNKRGL